VLLMIDNYDSFTYNLVQYFGELGADIRVFRNRSITCDEIAALNPSHLVISPGPCTPHEAGVSLAAISRFAGHIPILGICLGHQCLGQVFGGRVVKAGVPVHGKNSDIVHAQQGVFFGPALAFLGDALSLAACRACEFAGLPRGDGGDCERRNHGTTPPHGCLR